MTQIIISLLVVSVALNVYFFIRGRKDTKFLLETAYDAVNGNEAVKRTIPKRLNWVNYYIKYIAEQNRRMKHEGELANSKMDEIISVLTSDSVCLNQAS